MEFVLIQKGVSFAHVPLDTVGTALTVQVSFCMYGGIGHFSRKLFGQPGFV